MRELRLTQALACTKPYMVLACSFLFTLMSFTVGAQCIAEPGTLSGIAFIDDTRDGIYATTEAGVANAMVTAYDDEGVSLGFVFTDDNGYYQFNGLEDDTQVKLEFMYPQIYSPGILGPDNGSNIQFTIIPSCNNNIGLMSETYDCSDNPRAYLTCFTSGEVDGEFKDVETIVGLEHDIKVNSPVSKYATMGETGSVWGLAWKNSTEEIFSAAFVKQYSGLKNGPDAIFKTSYDGTKYATSLFTNLSDLGVNVAPLVTTDIDDCAYGAQVGKYGLGSMVISPDEQWLYVVNLTDNTLVKLSSTNPTPATTSISQIPDPGCTNGDARAFALVFRGNDLYVGVTCTAETSYQNGVLPSQLKEESSANVFKYNISNNTYQLEFTTNYIKGYWADDEPDSYRTVHWLTDLDFTDEGYMLLSLSDRLGHKFCSDDGRVDGQYPDLLVVYRDDNGDWTLENNGIVNGVEGTGVDNGDGPGGGEFFGYDYWLTQPDYHNETALGSIVVLPGSGEVLLSVYDPITNSYSGGLHRYRTSDGTKVGQKELYTRNFDEYAGKATGFGNIVLECGNHPIEVGNYVWKDSNNNGVQDAGETGISGLQLSIMDSECNLIGETTTDGRGYYIFNLSNVDRNQDGINDGLLPNEDYFIRIHPSVESDPPYYSIGGSQYNICPADHGNSNQIDCDIKVVEGVCDDEPVIALTTQDFGVNDHTFDIGLYRPTSVDLALMKELLSSNNLTYNSKVDYKITVYNQGEIIVESVDVTDYITDSYTFLEEDNPGWAIDGNKVSYTINEPLYPQQEKSIYIRLGTNGYSTSANLLNYAEISGATTSEGPITVDDDSSFDDIEGNDVGGDFGTDTDDEVNDIGLIDEDDHDVAGPNLFDLALMKEDLNPGRSYKSGDRVDFVISVYNQGLVDATTFTVVDYIPEELILLDIPANDGWILSGNRAYYTDDQGIVAGTKKEINIALELVPNLNAGQIINLAEISAAEGKDGLSVDYDSRADDINDNDTGGEVNSINDNNVNDHGDQDEDDADPVAITVAELDLALIKTVNTERALPGELVEFDIEVINQGTELVTGLEIVDYYPAELSLEDDNWMLTNPSQRKVYHEVTLASPLKNGDSYHTTVTFRVAPDSERLPLVNYAEIYRVYGANGEDISDQDSDSQPDNIDNNDEGAVAFTSSDNNVDESMDTEEDDHDVAVARFVDASTSGCICLNNATNSSNGQFEQIVTVNAPSGQTWYIDEVQGIFSNTSPAPPASPTPFATGPGGYILVENDLGNGTSDYELVGIIQDGQPYQITLRNENDIIESVSSNGCTYEDIIVDGATSICNGGTETYTVTNPSPSGIYIFDLPDGGEVVSSTNTSVTIDWDNAPGGPYALSVMNTESGEENCQSPTVIGGTGVSVGQSNGAVSCLAYVNVSLNQFCEYQVTPQTLVAGPLQPNSPYSVMLTMPDGSLIPGNLLTSEHLGVEVTAKLIEGCSGNSCWATITVEDKLPPVITCNDTEIVCYSFKEYEGPAAVDACDGNVEVEQIDESIFVYQCHPDYVRKVTRTYQATDSHGNVSDPCTIDIFVERIDINAIEYPADITGPDALACDEVPLDENGYPTLEATGQPTINGLPIINSITPLCNIAMDYNDRTVGPIGCTTKVMREFRLVYNTCNINGTDSIPETQLFKYTQTIELEDNNPPVFGDVEDISASAGSGDCMATVFIPAPPVSDACSDDIEIDIRYPGGFADNQSSIFIDLPAGDSEVTYLAYDECGNLDSISIIVSVEDNTAPVVVCDAPTAIGINSDGIGYAYASVFDDGSTDACGIDYMQVRRLDDGATCGPVSTDFSDFIVVCCEDVGTNVMVELLVVDFAGNENSCMVEIEVQDKFAPAITCPADLTIECGTEYDLEDLSTYGVATATDACMVTIEETAEFIPSNTCGEGEIIRTFVASDNNGSATCTQSIQVINSSPFVRDDITFPPNFETEICEEEALQPENLEAPFDVPTFDQDACDLVSYAFEDEVYDFSGDNACYKILRTFTVINWCVMVDGTPETFVGTQTIKVNNSVAPVINEDCDPITQCTFDDECESGDIVLTKSASDDCTEDNNMQWSYTITFGNGDDPISDNGAGNFINASGNYPIGSHEIIYTFLDRCGNMTSCIQEFNITNCTPPTAACLDGLIVELVPMDTDGDGEVDAEMACLFADQLDASSGHSCGLPIDFSFSADTTNNKMLYDCSNVGLNEVTLWVTDINGNTDICITTLEVQDNNDVDICPSIEDCVMFPADITVEVCNPDLTPDGIDATPIVDTDCANCDDFEITFTDDEIPYPNGDCNLFVRNFTVTFNCFNTPMIVEGSHVVSALDVIAPGITSPDDVTVAAEDGPLDCEALVELPSAVGISNCNSSITITNDSPFAFDDGAVATGNYPVGTTVVTFTATDACGNSSTAITTVTVTDEMSPECSLQDITISVSSTGSVTVDFDQIDAGSSDACGGLVTAVSITPNTFDCSDLGVNLVSVVVQDESGNTAQCSEVNITVVDNEAPICSTQDITVSIADGTTSIAITPDMVDDGSFDACGTASLVSVTPSVFGCDALGENIVTLVVTDEFGNTSSCTATVTVDDDVAPTCSADDITITLTSTDAITISGIDLDGGSTDECGTIVGYSVDPDTFDCDDLGVNNVILTVTDDSGNTSTCEGTVTVEDVVAPTCMVMDITISLDDNGFALINAGQINDGTFDECGFVQSISVNPFSFTCDDIGDNIVVFTAIDNNGNSSTCEATVTVQDDDAPECNVVDITVSLNSTVGVTITGDDVDAGSTDECGEVASITVDPDTFDCDDIGDNTVIVTVTDDSGNSSTCISIVTVEDETVPECLTQDITVNLDENGLATITPEDIDAGSSAGCADDVTLEIDINTFICNDVTAPVEVTLTVTSNSNGDQQTCTAIVTVVDTIPPTIECMADVTVDCADFTGSLEPYGNIDDLIFDDNCPAGVTVTEEVVEDVNSCNIGTYTRTFTVTDLVGLSASCTQVITVVLGDNPLMEEDLTFPPDTVFFGDCSTFDPDNLDTTVEIDSMGAECFDVSVTFVDMGANPDMPCNDTITRTYTVIDACQDGTGGGTFTFEQTIIINDTTAPIVIGPQDTTLTIMDTMTCLAVLDLSDFSVENCDENFTVTNDSEFADSNDTGDASGSYPIGDHLITLTATDNCGNSSQYSYNVTVEDSLYIYLTCLKIEPPMEADLSVDVHAEQLIDTLLFFDCAGTVYDTIVSFSATDINDTITAYGCEAVPQPVQARIYLWIDGVVVDSCRGTVQLRDPDDLCQDGLTANIIGSVFTTGNQPIPEVYVDLDGSGLQGEMTGTDGKYAFPEMPYGGEYEVVPYKNDDPLNGVTTLDLLLIQRHILALTEFDDPYDIIAADINANGSVSSTDVIQLRKLILGVYDEFPSNTSWRMIDRAYEFFDESNPLAEALPETYDIDYLNSNMKIDFIGIKVGDVNGTVEPDGLQASTDVEVRSKEVLHLQAQDQFVAAGERVTVEISVENAVSLQGFQTTLDILGAEDIEITSDQININSDHYVDNGRGQVMISWSDINSTSIDTDAELIMVEFTATMDMQLSESVAINSNLLPSEVYEDFSVPYESLDIRWNNDLTNSWTVANATPNPWSDLTNVQFEIPRDGEVSLTIRTVDGKKVYATSGHYERGRHSIAINQSDLDGYGVYYYILRYEGQSVAKKMILIK